MKILYLHQYFNTLRDAGGTRSYEIARRLVARGHEVTIVTSVHHLTSDAPVLRRSFVTHEDGVCVHWLPVPYSNSMTYPRRIWAFSHFALRAALEAASIDNDVVFATSTPLTVAIPAVVAQRRHHSPMVFEVRDLWPEVPILIGAIKGRVPITLARWLERFAYRHAQQIVALSPGMSEGIVRCGYPAERVSIIPNFAHLDLFSVPPEEGWAFRRRHDWLQDRPLVVYAGTLGRANDVGYLARVAAAMRDLWPEVRFLVVGTGFEATLIRDLAQQLGVLNRNFVMMEPIPKQDVPALLSAATVATSLFADNPAFWANSANKFFDALAAGVPIAINYQGWQADLIEESGCGLVMPVHDPRQAAVLLRDLLMDHSRLQRAGEAAKLVATTRFHPDTVVDQFERVLIEASAAGRSAGWKAVAASLL